MTTRMIADTRAGGIYRLALGANCLISIATLLGCGWELSRAVLGDTATDLSVPHGKHVVAYGITFAAAGVMGWFSYHAFRRRITPPQWATLTAVGLVGVALLVIRFA